MPFPENGWESLQPALKIVEFRRGDYLLKELQICSHIYFVEMGICRSYFCTNGREINTAFHFEGDIVTNLKSFGAGERSDYNILAITDMRMVAMEKRALRLAAQTAPEIEELGKNCLRNMAIRLEEQANVLKIYKPLERYTYIEKHYPQMIQQLPLSELASYLGIARETLSRIRKRRGRM